eukprot:Gb_05825 [translate_table: standard]
MPPLMHLWGLPFYPLLHRFIVGHLYPLTAISFRFSIYSMRRSLHLAGSSWVIFTHSQLFHFAFPFTPCAGVCTLLVRPFHASAALFPFLLGTTSSFHSAWEDGLVPMIIATAIAGCCGPFGTGSGFFAEDVRSHPGRQMLRGKTPP